MVARGLERELRAADAEAAARSTGKRERDDGVLARRSLRSPQASELDGVLSRGLSSLPLDAKQRARAKSLAKDAVGYFARPSGAARRQGETARRTVSVDAIAAAIAYAIVYVDHVPLTQADVAACFRVSVAGLRGRFGELRSHLDLLPGDARYATLRQR